MLRCIRIRVDLGTESHARELGSALSSDPLHLALHKGECSLEIESKASTRLGSIIFPDTDEERRTDPLCSAPFFPSEVAFVGAANLASVKLGS